MVSRTKPDAEVLEWPPALSATRVGIVHDWSFAGRLEEADAGSKAKPLALAPRTAAAAFPEGAPGFEPRLGGGCTYEGAGGSVLPSPHGDYAVVGWVAADSATAILTSVGWRSAPVTGGRDEDLQQPFHV